MFACVCVYICIYLQTSSIKAENTDMISSSYPTKRETRTKTKKRGKKEGGATKKKKKRKKKEKKSDRTKGANDIYGKILSNNVCVLYILFLISNPKYSILCLHLGILTFIHGQK